MPLAPNPPVCENCNTPMPPVRVKLICEQCPNEQSVEVGNLHELPMRWPCCHEECMSLEQHSECTVCDNELTEHFKYGRMPLDWLPGTYDARVFVGGNYDLMGSLRDIKNAVHRLGDNFVPILPYDDFEIPPGQIYEWDLRLLHNCRYAIFEVTQPAGELFEIARCTEYGVKTLLVYQARGAAEAPPRARTMLLQSGSHEHRSYRDTAHLEQIVDEFLRQKSPTQWKRAVNLMGFKFTSYDGYSKLHGNGETEHRCSYRGLNVTIPDLRKSEIAHGFKVSSGHIIPGSFELVAPQSMTWRRDGSQSGEKAEVGVVRFDPLIDNLTTSPTDYTFNFRTQGAYVLTKSQLSELPFVDIDDPFLEAGLEFASREITYPMEIFKLSVEFPAGYPVSPKPVAYFGIEPRSDGLKMPPDIFSFENNIAKLEVRKPRIYYRYAITWELPSELPQT